MSTFLTDSQEKAISFFTQDIYGSLRSQSRTLSDGQGLVFTKVVHDQGAGYSSTTGRYTVPMTGTYVMTATLQGHGQVGDLLHVFLVVDGQDHVQAATHMARDGGRDTTSLQALLYLTAGQQVWLRAEGSSTILWDHPLANTFGGVLIAADSGMWPCDVLFFRDY